MTFVFPFLLGGLLLAGLPVLLHFLVRKKPTTLAFPAFRFLIQKRRSNTRNLRLKHLLLMLVRIALIALLCLALARPRLVHESFGISRERPVALALLFDTTPSMAYRSGEQTRLDLAKKRALELLDELPDNCRVLILDAADPASFARADWLPSLEQARQRIQSLTIRPESVPVTKALEEAQRRLDRSDDAELQRLLHVICIFSDRTKASWDTGVSLPRTEEIIPTQKLYFDVGIDDPIDLAILSAHLGDARPSFLPGEKIPLNVVVRSTTTGANTLIVKAGEHPLEQRVNFDAGKAQTLALAIDSAHLKPGLHQAEVSLETLTDALPHNNKRFLTFRIAPEPHVLVLTDDAKKASAFADALSALHYKVTHKSADAKEDLSKYDAVFLVGVAAPPVKLWQTLERYVTDGGNVGIVLPGDNLQSSAYTSDEAMKVMPARVQKKMDGVPRDWDLANADWSHPFLATYHKWLADEVEYDFIRNPRTATKYWQVKPLNKKSVIVTYAGTADPADPVIVERPASKKAGKVLLVTTPMDEPTPSTWNNYNERLVSFYLALPLWCARFLCAEPEQGTINYVLGQQPPTMKAPTQPFAKYLLTSGEFSEEIRFDDKGLWVGERLPRAGNYLVTGVNPDRAEVLHRFSVNIAAEESDLTRVNVSEIEAVLGKDTVIPQDRRRSIVDTLNWDEPIELFPWLLIALLFLLAFENLLANRFYRRSLEPDA